MRVVDALRILETAILDCKDCKTRGIDTSDVRKALEVLEPYCWPDWRIDGFRHQLISHKKNGPDKNQQQILAGYFGGIYGCVRNMLALELERLNYRLRQTPDALIRAEADLLTTELASLPDSWRFSD